LIFDEILLDFEKPFKKKRWRGEKVNYLKDLQKRFVKAKSINERRWLKNFYLGYLNNYLILGHKEDYLGNQIWNQFKAYKMSSEGKT